MPRDGRMIEGSLASRILAWAKEQPNPFTTAEVKEALGIKSKFASARLNQLYEAGRLLRVDRAQGRGMYAFWIHPANRKEKRNGD